MSCGHRLRAECVPLDADCSEFAAQLVVVGVDEGERERELVDADLQRSAFSAELSDGERSGVPPCCLSRGLDEEVGWLVMTPPPACARAALPRCRRLSTQVTSVEGAAMMGVLSGMVRKSDRVRSTSSGSREGRGSPRRG